MNSKTKSRLAITIPTLLLFATTSFAATPSREVQKSDGTKATYRLLPVHHDLNHEREVSYRLEQQESNFAVPAAYNIPASLIPAVRDQGQRGTCAYFATMAITEAYYMAQSPNNSKISLSEECLVDVRNWMFDQGAAYSGSDKPDQRPDPNGDLPNSIVKTIEKNGVPASGSYGSVDCKYDGNSSNGSDVSLGSYLSTFSGTKASQAYGKGVRYDENTAPTVNAVKALIANNTPVEIGIVVYNEYMNETDWRFVAATDTDGNIAGGHAITLTGYKTVGTSTIFTFKNSWGPSWGKSGYGTLDDALLTHSWGYDPSYDFVVSLHK